MDRFLMTHSLLFSWQYALRENPYEDATSEIDPMADFMHTLRREHTETTEAQQRGIDFENLVTDICYGRGDRSNKWWDAASHIADIVRGGQFQYRAKKQIEVAGKSVVLYGRLDVLKAGTIYDIKYAGKYDRGKFVDSTQHPAYLLLVPEATKFEYLVSDGTNNWTETYRRDETPGILPTIERFYAWLEATGLWAEYVAHWTAL